MFLLDTILFVNVAVFYRWLDKSVDPCLPLLSSGDLGQTSVGASATFPKKGASPTNQIWVETLD